MSPIKICLIFMIFAAYVMADDQTSMSNIGKREAPEVKTRILGLLGLGRKKRQAGDEQVQTRILGMLGRKKRQAEEEEIRTRILGALGRKKRDLTLDQLVQVADILSR